ncbi:hypothetical protein [Nocardia sp. XZ_19_385]|uniref:hypothetical protein n=1 Tax=Nocardia sp. XZ_19_385 TaxID=2769488 RepID=UPI00188E0603|nr:hypothetical protein [Nocardia sp. XZ_19_385]
MRTKLRVLATGSAAAAIAVVAAAGPAAAGVTVKGAKDNTITAQVTQMAPTSVCTLHNISTTKQVSKPVGPDGTVTLVLTKVRRGPHAVNVTCKLPDGTVQVLADHRAAPVTA